MRRAGVGGEGESIGEVSVSVGETILHPVALGMVGVEEPRIFIDRTRVEVDLVGDEHVGLGSEAQPGGIEVRGNQMVPIRRRSRHADDERLRRPGRHGVAAGLQA